MKLREDPIHSLVDSEEKGWMHLQSALPCPLLPPSHSLKNLSSEGNWPHPISPIRGAMHLNATTNAEILLQMMHSSLCRRAQFGILHSYLWVAANLALPCIHSTFHLGA